jgi:hypothetical protein
MQTSRLSSLSRVGTTTRSVTVLVFVLIEVSVEVTVIVARVQGPSPRSLVGEAAEGLESAFGTSVGTAAA